MEIVRTIIYAKAVKRIMKLGASAEDITAMENAIALSPDAGDVIPGTHGLRKIRFGYARAGKRGGGRTVYFAKTEAEVVYLIFAYAKVDATDLTADQRKLFGELVKELKDG